MKKFTKKVKIYILLSIILMIFVSKIVSAGIDSNLHITVDNLVNNIKTLKFKYEFDNISQASNIQNSPEIGQISLDYTKSVPVIVYHGIPYSDIPNEFSITLDNFKNQIFALKKAGYNTITTSELYSYLKGEITLPEKSILITFDDGRVDSYEMADPILKALDYKATMFVIGRYSLQNERQGYYLSKEQLKTMEQSGRWDIEAHSYDGHESYFTSPDIQDGHFFSHKQWVNSEDRLETDDEFRQRITLDFQKVKIGLENLMNKQILSFAFPYGDFGQNNTNYKTAEDINIQESQKLFQMDFYQTSPSQRYKNNYLFEEKFNSLFFLIKRINIDPTWAGYDLIDELDKTTVKNLPFADNFVVNTGWLTLWGKTIIGNGSLIISTDKDETGATILLDGSRLWKNYSIKADITSPNSTSVYVWARFQDDNNNAACNFGNGFVHIEQTIDGKTTTIQGVIDKAYNMTSEKFKVEARVNDRDIKCLINDQIIVSTPFLDPKLDTGGLGFKTWSPEPNKANLIIENLTVEPL